MATTQNNNKQIKWSPPQFPRRIDKFRWMSNPWQIDVSGNGYDIIYETFGKSTSLVVYVPHPCVNPSGQSCISRILRTLSEKHQFKLVCIDGATGGFNSSVFDSVPDPSLKEGVLKYLLNEARLSGAEYEWLLHLTPGARNAAPFTLWGVERSSLYEYYWEAWVRSWRIRVRGELGRIAEQNLEWVRNEYGHEISEQLVEYEKLTDAFRQGWGWLKEYLSQSVRLAEANQVARRDFSLVQELAQNYPGDRLRTRSSLGLACALRLDELEREISLKLARSSAEREYVRKSRLARLFLRLIDLNLTQREWEEYQSMRPVWEEFPRIAHRVNPADLEPFHQLYEGPQSQVLIENALSKMREMELNQMVLVADGQYCRGIINGLRHGRTSYLVIVPKVETPTDPEAYANAMFNHLPIDDEEIESVIELISEEDDEPN